MKVHPIILEEGQNEFLLSIHASLKERAKRIHQERRWDGRRKCWVYPHTEDIYASIIAEFGDELDNRICLQYQEPHQEAEITSSAENSSLGVADFEVNDNDSIELDGDNKFRIEIEELRIVVSQLHAELTSMARQSAKYAEELVATHNELRIRQNETLRQPDDRDLDQLSEAIRERDQRIVQLQEMRDAQAAKNLDLRIEVENSAHELRRLKHLLDSGTPTKNDKQYLLKLALRASAGNAAFAAILASHDFDARFSNILTNAMTSSISSRLKITPISNNLNDLLATTRDSRALNDDQLDLAHLIRRQRNMITHDNSLSKSSVTVRTLLCLFAAALLWPSLQPSEVSE